MTLPFPRASAPITTAGHIMGPEWIRFFSRFWAELGFQKEAPHYRDHPAQIDFGGSGLSKAVISGIIQGYAFPKDADNQTDGFLRLPNEAKTGATITPYIVVIPQGASGNMIWGLSYAFGDDSGAMSAIAVEEITTDTDGLQYKPVRVDFSAIGGDDLSAGSNLALAITREGADVLDTHEDDVIFLGAGVKYQIEGLATVNAHP